MIDPTQRQDSRGFATAKRVLAALVPAVLLLATPVAGQNPVVGQNAAEQPTVKAAEGEAAAPESAEQAVRGRVFGESQPVAAATVFAYEVVSLAMKRAVTDGQGHFLFGSLPAGMYQIVAFKPGYSASVQPLLRRRDDLNQFIELRLRDERLAESRQEDGFWAVRSRIPTDVLREIDFLTSVPERQAAGFGAEMVADSGVERLSGFGDAQLTTAALDVQGTVGELELGFLGQYQQLAQQTGGELRIPDGEASALAVEITDPRRDSKLRVTTSTAEAANVRRGEVEKVGRDHYEVNWAGRTGDKGRSGVRAQYTEEFNFNQPAWIQLSEIPNASRWFNFEGFYSSNLGEATTLEAGVSYSQLDGTIGPLSGLIDSRGLIQERIGLYGLAGTQIQPRVFVEVGLYSTYRDGSLSLMPHGGMVVQLGSSDWEAHTALSHRIEESGETEQIFTGFNSAFFSDRTSCQQAGEACYEVTFRREDEDRKDDEISVGAVHREFAETLRLYFSPDFFDRLESLFVVDGDEVPELQFRWVRRLSPRVLAKLESNFAAGGGGIFYATNESMPYENEVRYLVTSLDTQFQNTATGVFVAFHHLEQALNPIDQPADTAAEMEVQRLQLMLTQDLSILADVAANWAVRLNLELSRGATPYALTDDDEVSKKLTGGISVSF